MYKKLVLFLLLFQFNLLADPNCNHLISKLPEINGASIVDKRVGTKAYRIYEGVTAQALKNSDDYDQFVKNTVEVFFEPAEPFGHIRLRVGENVYSFNYIQSTSMSAYSPRAGNGHFGFVYYVDPQKITQLKDEMAQFYGHSSSYNFPPFDAYSPPLKVVKDGDRWKYISPSDKYANNSAVNADIIEENGKHYFSKDGYKFPIKKLSDDTYEVQSYSCISSADYWTRRFGVELNPRYSAKSLKEALLTENHGLTQPDIIMKYGN
jgi:hypothetical protein